MPLYSLILDHEKKSFTTQIKGENATDAISIFVDNFYPNMKVEAFGSTAPDLKINDIIFVTPMVGLINLWAACVGKDGRYVEIVCVRTESQSGNQK